ncbi:MAG: HK97 family phage prohead protease [Candidatus Caldarchaeum sp.]|nr:HK97 family phage prohead protease [Candidatus Caldarchaeum sp.]MCX8200819.1 HK97 family phage prohead protease [Candidatus Caldarchaeum sp.]MDW8434801.1 hypothetical protein [Candidatus Caldarchaeum sp.]
MRWEANIVVRPCLMKEDAGEFAGFFEGVAATDDVDLEGDRFSEEVLKSNAAKLVGRPVLMFHGRDKIWGSAAVGEIVEAAYKSGRGLWIRAGIYRAFENVWKMVKNGFLKALSIGGVVKRISFHEGFREIEDAEITEVSLTTKAVNPGARIYMMFGKSVCELQGPKAVVSGHEAVVKNESTVLETPFFRSYWMRRCSQRIKNDLGDAGRHEL